MNLFCTIVTRSHLPGVWALSESLRSAGNAEELHVLLADARRDQLPVGQEGLCFHGFDEIAGELPAHIRHYFDPFELCNALKPFLVGLLFRAGAERVIYLDSDLMVVGSFSSVWDGFEQAALQVTHTIWRRPGWVFRGSTRSRSSIWVFSTVAFPPGDVARPQNACSTGCAAACLFTDSVIAPAACSWIKSSCRCSSSIFPMT